MLCTYAKQLGRAVALKNASTLLFKPSLVSNAYCSFISSLSAFPYRQFNTIPNKNSSNQDIPSNQSIPPPQRIAYNNPETDVFMAGLDRFTTKETLKEFFKSAGEISSIYLPLHPDGTLKGYVFIRFVDSKSVKSALALSGKQFLGKIIKVSGINAKNDTNNNRRIFVGNISLAATQEDIHKHFSQYGQILRTMLKADDDGRSRGFAFVEFTNSEAAKKACNSVGFVLKGKALDVKYAFDKPRPASGDISKNEQKPVKLEEDVKKDEKYNKEAEQPRINERKDSVQENKHEEVRRRWGDMRRSNERKDLALGDEDVEERRWTRGVNIRKDNERKRSPRWKYYWQKSDEENDEESGEEESEEEGRIEGEENRREESAGRRY